MKSPRTYMVMDYENYSQCDIKKAGAAEYAKHPSTETFCAAFRIGTREQLPKRRTRLMLPWENDADYSAFYSALADPSIHLVAHNALYEYMITRYVRKGFNGGEVFTSDIPLERWHCTAALSRSVGLPGRLELVGPALGMKYQKDIEGHKAMLKVCKPRKDGTRNTDGDTLEQLFSYCISDTDAEVELFLTLPPLHVNERRFWFYDQVINLRGFQVDRKLAKNALKLIEREVDILDTRVRESTGGELNSARQGKAFMSYLKERGLDLPNMQKATIEQALIHTPMDAHCRELLETRQSVARSSTSKYAAFELRSRYDGRARDNTIFYGAHTGRQAGTGLQPQNMFRSVLGVQDLNAGIELMQAGDFHAIQALFDRPMDLYASAVRSCLIAAPGKVLDVGDFATIEVRVLFWLAGHTAGLKALASGLDLYLDMAAAVYQMNPTKLVRLYKEKHFDAINKRQLGKCGVLGCGFGMGINGIRFKEMAKDQYGLDIDISLSKKAVSIYRQKHAPVVKFWEVIETAAKLAMQNPGKAYRHDKLCWKLDGDWLTCQLPIGRRLSYYKPQLRRKHTRYGESLVLTYMGTDAISKKYVRMETWGGKLAENVTQAVARDKLMDSVERIEKRGTTQCVLLVHDEIAGERIPKPILEFEDEDHQNFLADMAEVPAWAEGLPIKVEGWTGERYRK